MKHGEIRCELCAYWDTTDVSNLGYGECHRIPAPVPGATWPVLHRTDWCGEFRKLEVEVELEPEPVKTATNPAPAAPGKCEHKWPILGCSKCMDLLCYASSVGESETMRRPCNHVYPEVGCSKCMELLVDVDADGALHLRPPTIQGTKPQKTETIRSDGKCSHPPGTAACSTCCAMVLIKQDKMKWQLQLLRAGMTTPTYLNFMLLSGHPPAPAPPVKESQCLCGGVGCIACLPDTGPFPHTREKGDQG